MFFYFFCNWAVFFAFAFVLTSTIWRALTKNLVFLRTVEGTALGCFFSRKVHIGGDIYTVNVADYEFDDFGTFVFPRLVAALLSFVAACFNCLLFFSDTRHGVSYRQIVDLSNPDSSLFIQPMGQNESPYSSSYDSMLEQWRKGEYLSMNTKDYAVRKSLEITPK